MTEQEQELITSLFKDLKGDMKDGFDKMDERFDQMNGRVRATEQEVAVLKDRSDTLQRDSTRSKAAGFGGGIVAAIVGVVELVKVLK